MFRNDLSDRKKVIAIRGSSRIERNMAFIPKSFAARIAINGGEALFETSNELKREVMTSTFFKYNENPLNMSLGPMNFFQRNLGGSRKSLLLSYQD